MEEENAAVTAILKAAQFMGYQHLKEEQKLALKSFIGGRDVFVCLPTGYGKTLCYCLLPKVFDFFRGTSQSVIVVVSPLIALMQDQVRAMAGHSIR